MPNAIGTVAPAQQAAPNRALVGDYVPASDTSLESWEPSVLKPWPVLDRAALPGLAGEFVDLATANSETDPAAVLATFLVRFACEAGGPDPATRPHILIGDSRHDPRLFAVVAGQSSKARKGTSAAPVTRLFTLPDSGLPMAAISPGPLSTGEGLVSNVKDAILVWEEDKKTSHGEWKVKDPGVPDKRLIIMDEELAAGLRCSKREGNTLSPTLRSFWDNGCVQPLTKSSPTKTTNAHVNILAHITLEELARVLDEGELFNGFANRFLWVLARRTRLISRPSPMPSEELLKLQAVLLGRLKFAHSAGLMTLDDSAYELWDGVYPSLAKERGGLFGAVVGRSEAQVQRLAMIYALLDREAVIGIKHLEAALAFWNYCEASAAYIFKDRQADPLQEKILAVLKASPHPLTATELHRALGNSCSQDQMKKALGSLASRSLVIHEKEATKTKPRNLFRLNEKSEFIEHSSCVEESSETSDNSPERERRPEEENLPAVFALPEGGAR